MVLSCSLFYMVNENEQANILIYIYIYSDTKWSVLANGWMRLSKMPHIQRNLIGWTNTTVIFVSMEMTSQRQ